MSHLPPRAPPFGVVDTIEQHLFKCSPLELLKAALKPLLSYYTCTQRLDLEAATLELGDGARSASSSGIFRVKKLSSTPRVSLSLLALWLSPADLLLT